MTEKSDGGWKVDRNIPIAPMVAIALQLLAAVWWGSQMDARVSHIEALQRATPNPSERIVRVEVGMEAIKERLAEIKTLLMARPRSLPP